MGIEPNLSTLYRSMLSTIRYTTGDLSMDIWTKFLYKFYNQFEYSTRKYMF